MSVWITGAGGLIGSYLLRNAPVPAKGLTRYDLDLLDFEAVRRHFKNDKPELILHCAGLTKTPECDKNPELASKLNVEATKCLVNLGVKLVFFSTDLVFDGRSGSYKESDSPNPLSVYGVTKVDAEEVVLQNARNIVIRTSINGGVSPTGDRGFNEQMKIAWKQGRSLTLFVDEYRSPIAASETAKAVWSLALQEQGGIFHVAGNERLSRYDIGKLVADRHPELNPMIEQSSIKEYEGPPRPADTSLDCRKAEALIGWKLPKFSEWLPRNLEDF